LECGCRQFATIPILSATANFQFKFLPEPAQLRAGKEPPAPPDKIFGEFSAFGGEVKRSRIFHSLILAEFFFNLDPTAHVQIERRQMEYILAPLAVLSGAVYACASPLSGDAERVQEGAFTLFRSQPQRCLGENQLSSNQLLAILVQFSFYDTEALSPFELLPRNVIMLRSLLARPAALGVISHNLMNFPRSKMKRAHLI
jgi:hypothetical protein